MTPTFYLLFNWYVYLNHVNIVFVYHYYVTNYYIYPYLQTIHTCRNHTDVANIVLFNVNETVRFCIIHNVIHVLCLKRVYDLINTILLLLYLRFSPVKLFISIALIYVTSVNDASLYETWGSTFTPCTALV